MTSKQTTVKPWAGRFSESTDSFVESFTESVSFDKRLAHFDIEGSLAHVKMLAHVDVLTDEECQHISEGLLQIRQEIESGNFKWQSALEDVHMNIESALVSAVGEVGKKLHTGRSRNDQIATDLRLYLRVIVDQLCGQLVSVQSELLGIAEQEAETILPGLTHMQSAQPITFGHHMLAWYEMLKRDHQRLRDCQVRIDVMPLGSAALAGTSFPIDREFSANLLGFDTVSSNSLDAVSDRDFVIEFVSACSIIMMHLSRFSEELVLWMSPQFGFIDLGDAWCTGSSIMPQKKNPDLPELVRGKTGRVYGALMGLLTLMKAQPLAYNRDNQEDKESLFDVIDTVQACLQAYAGMLPTMVVKRPAMLEAAERGYGTATDMADYLVKKGLPFRDAHEVVGKAVHFAIESNKRLAELSIDELRSFSDDLEEDVYAVLELSGSVAARDHTGGTAVKQVQAAIQQARDYLASLN
ncbi:MAG: argininosuccinate lyase [Gammaproteobacteria bacterium]|nr:argininosuccinate lyase [Gammaproteobacteria bacterium]